MIPRRIHYFWSGSAMPADVRDMVLSWTKLNPEYELVHWDDACLPQTAQVAFLRKEQRWTALSDFARAYAIYHHGGFYLDTDVRLVKSLEALRTFPAFICTEAYPISLNAAASGGVSGNKFFGEVLGALQGMDLAACASDLELEVGPRNVTRVFLQEYGLPELTQAFVDQIQTLSDLTVLPKRFFFPYNWNESFSEACIHPDETFGIHLWKKRW